MCYKGKNKQWLCILICITIINMNILSVCLPTVLIPIIKLSTSPNILSKEFRPSLVLLVTCWILTLIVIGFDIYLFIKHAINLWAAIIIGISGTIYLLFLVYLVWKPLEINDKTIAATEDGWMSLPQHDDELDDPVSSLDNSLNSSNHYNNNNRRANKFDDDAEEIYAL